MSQIAFQAKVGLLNATPLNIEMTQWESTLQFIDLEGVQSGLTIQVGDVVAFDTTTYDTGTFTFYSVTSIITADSAQPVVVLEYMAVNDNPFGSPDLSYVIGVDGVISRPSVNFGLLPVVSTDVQILPDKYTEYIQNYNFVQIVDNLFSDSQQTMSFTTGTSQIGRVVYMSGDNTVAHAANNSILTTKAIGIVVATDKVAVSGRVSGFAGLTPGAQYFLALDGLLTTTPPTTEGSFIAPIAIANTPTDLTIQIQRIVEL